MSYTWPAKGGAKTSNGVKTAGVAILSVGPAGFALGVFEATAPNVWEMRANILTMPEDGWKIEYDKDPTCMNLLKSYLTQINTALKAIFGVVSGPVAAPVQAFNDALESKFVWDTSSGTPQLKVK